MPEYGRIHTDGSRSGGQPLIANRKAHTMILEVLAEWGIKPRSATAQQLHVATTEALCRSIKTSETLRQPTQSDVSFRELAAVLYRKSSEFQVGLTVEDSYTLAAQAIAFLQEQSK